jgi:large repetitive protein
VCNSPVRHRALTSRIHGLPTNDPEAVAPDVLIQTALMEAGEEALPAPSRNGITVYWVPQGTSHTPYAIMIDAAEPLWRTRTEPRLEDVTDVNGRVIDAAFQRPVFGEASSLTVFADPGYPISGFVHSTGGCRTLAFIDLGFARPAEDFDIQLQLGRPPSQMFGLSYESAVLVSLQFAATPPWEEDNV